MTAVRPSVSDEQNVRMGRIHGRDFTTQRSVYPVTHTSQWTTGTCHTVRVPAEVMWYFGWSQKLPKTLCSIVPWWYRLYFFGTRAVVALADECCPGTSPELLSLSLGNSRPRKNILFPIMLSMPNLASFMSNTQIQTQVQIQIRTCRVRLTNCPGTLTKC